MVFLAEMILMGIWATFFMDFTAKRLIRSGIVRATLEPQFVGRWALYTIRGKLVHEDIRQTPLLQNEEQAALISHYLIGIVLAGVYLVLEFLAPAMRGRFWLPLLFGITTILLPWLWLYPSIGIGFLALKSPKKSDYFVLSTINHTNFGLGMMIWILVFRRFFA